jgi:hypothetical protein
MRKVQKVKRNCFHSPKKVIMYIVLFFFVTFSSNSLAERPLEDPSFRDGISAIAQMHGLNALGLAGELITIYGAFNEASKAASIFHDNKWRPGDDDLSWVDRRRSNWKDPLSGLDKKNRQRVNLRLSNIKHLQTQINDYSSTNEKLKACEAVKIQYGHLVRTLSEYSGMIKTIRDIDKKISQSCMDSILAAQNLKKIAGKWDTNFKILTIDRSGGGKYPHDKGRIQGSINGRVLTGKWYEAPSYKPPKDAGDFRFVFTENWESFSGDWRKGFKNKDDKKWDGHWDGTRVK